MTYQQMQATYAAKAQRYSKAQCLFAISDCHETLRSLGAEIEKHYETQLWAEIDAMRDRLAALTRKEAA